ncbi:MAG TPA: ScyD/ScyE family protein [Actinomycetota bacterium]|nr:ScyD/ScyE family protein [Actinomycetota bacterium]
MLAVRRRRRWLALLAAVAALLIVGPPAAAHPRVTVVAGGLDNPRGLGFAPDGSLYVAEAGRGGSGPCFEGPEGPACFGASGAVTRLRHGHQTRVVTGLPSSAAPDGSSAIGPSDVAAGHDGTFVTVGLGANPALRDQVPALGDMGQLVRISRRGSTRLVADLGDFEAEANPDGGLPDSNPNSVLAGGRFQVVADAGGNSLLRVSAKGKVSVLATFPDRMVAAPPFLGLPPGTQIPMQSVPTSVVRGPDGAYYVGELTGFPFQVGAARVHRVVPGHKPKVVATGFTNIIDLAFGKDRRLYVLEIAHNGLLSGDQTGALIRVGSHGSRKLLLSTGLVMPGGLAIRGDHAYVSNCGVCAGTGTVLRVALH